MAKNNNSTPTIKTWLASNLWNILSVVVVMFSAAIYLKTEVRANAMKIQKLEEIVAKYPSEDWFELKFENIDKRFNDLEEDSE